MELADLRRIKARRPKGAGSYWRAFSHADFIDGFLNAMLGRGWTVDENPLLLHVSPTKSDMLAVFEISREFHHSYGECFVAALRQSTARRFTPRIYLAMRDTAGYLTCCESILFTRLTTNSNIIECFDRVADKMITEAHYTGMLCEKLKKIVLDRIDLDRVLLTAGRRRIIPWSSLGDVDSIFNDEDPCCNGMTLWEAFSTMFTSPLDMFGQSLRCLSLIQELS